MEKESDLISSIHSTFHRVLNPLLGRWFSVDPEFAEYSSFSNFSVMANNPLYNIDHVGDRIRASLGMRLALLRFRIAARRNQARAARNGNVSLQSAYTQVLTDYQTMRNSNVTYQFDRTDFGKKNDYKDETFNLKAAEDRQENSGFVVVQISGKSFQSMAGAITAGALFEGRSISLTKDNVSDYVYDQTDARAIYTAQSAWIEGGNFLNGDVDWMRQNYINKAMQSSQVSKLPQNAVNMDTVAYLSNGDEMSTHDPANMSTKEMLQNQFNSGNSNYPMAIPDFGNTNDQFFIDNQGNWSSPKIRKQNFETSNGL